MQSYLPKDTAGTSSGYAEGGGLYALGLIHANHGGEITEYLLGKNLFDVPVSACNAISIYKRKGH
jgi:hypothetical protein